MTNLNTRVAEAQGWVLLKTSHRTYGGTVWDEEWYAHDAPPYTTVHKESVLETYGRFEGTFSIQDYPRPLHAKRNYTPSTDLNQAMAFAEWAALKHSLFFEFSLQGMVGLDGVSYLSTFDVHRSRVDVKNPAEALCLATLKDLEKEENV